MADLIWECNNCDKRDSENNGLIAFHQGEVAFFLCGDCCAAPALKVTVRKIEDAETFLYDGHTPLPS